MKWDTGKVSDWAAEGLIRVGFQIGDHVLIERGEQRHVDGDGIICERGEQRPYGGIICEAPREGVIIKPARETISIGAPKELVWVQYALALPGHRDPAAIEVSRIRPMHGPPHGIPEPVGRHTAKLPGKRETPS